MSNLLSSDPAVEIHGLTKRFGRSVAVNNLTLSIPRGCAFGLLGPNGAGKSTTLRILMGTLAPTAGEALILSAPALDGQNPGPAADSPTRYEQTTCRILPFCGQFAARHSALSAPRRNSFAGKHFRRRRARTA
jgi:energy-coupling factor transporter ATP-binding protein EcfA2